MERWAGKTAMVTGASGGIGAAIAVALANAGLRVAGLARRDQLVEELKSQVTGSGSLHSRKCDVSKPEEVTAAFQWAEETFGAVHVMVNNAGIFVQGNISDLADAQISDEQLHSLIDTNLKATILCSRRAISSMKKHGVDGHIVNISSIAGQYVPFAPIFNVYSSTKHGVTAFSNALTNELAHVDSGIRVTNVSPGLVDTPMVGGLRGLPALQPSDVADAVLYALSTPPNVLINEISISSVREKRL